MTRPDHVAITPGANRWLIGRTSRDGVSPEDAKRTTLIVLTKWLQSFSPLGMRAVYAEQSSSYAIGAARPLIIDVKRFRPTLELLEKTQRSQDCRIVRTLGGADDPWWIVVKFVWNGGAVVRPWPRMSVNAIGVEDDNDQALDWLLIEAAPAGVELLGKVDEWHKSA